MIVLDRPERMNSMAFELMVPLHDAFEKVAADNETTCVILTGTGRGFCSGADTQETEPPPTPSNSPWFWRRHAESRVGACAAARRVRRGADRER